MISIRVISTKRRVRSASMRIVANSEIELRVPVHISIEDISAFIARSTAFLEKSRKVNTHTLRKVLSEHNQINIFGIEMQLHFEKSRSIRVEIEEQSRVVTVFKPGIPTISLTRFYKATNAYLLPKLESLSAKAQELLGIDELQEVRLKKVRSIWGSCSRNGNITYNSRLIHYPESSLWYIVCHEVSHLIEHNHSKRFWDLVRKINPEYKRERVVLKKHLFG